MREGRREGRAHVGGECGVSVCASVRCCVRVDQGAGVSTGERETVCFRPTRIGPIIKSNPVRRINTCIPNRAATVCPVAGARAAWGSFLFGDMDDSEILDYGSDDGAGEAKQGGKHHLECMSRVKESMSPQLFIRSYSAWLVLKSLGTLATGSLYRISCG